ncbi:MAG: proprotein convertase P-domain-containing protein, partial [Planctomycetota bacterium]
MMRCEYKTLLLVALLVVFIATQYGLAVSYDSTDVPKDITKTGTITSTIQIDESGPIDNLDVELDISFPWDEDLDVYLVAPDDMRVELFTDVGSIGVDFTGTILDDEAAMSIRDGVAPFTGRYQPEGRLSDLTGKEMQGTWTLEITNDAGWFNGTLNSWSLLIGENGGVTYPPPPLPVNPNPEDEATDVPIDAILSWRLSAEGPPTFRLLAATFDEGPDPYTLFELQTDPATAVLIGETPGVHALDYSPNGELFGCVEYTLWKLDVSDTGVSSTEIGDFHTTTDPSILLTGLAFHPDGTLYGCTFDDISKTSVIYTIDEETAYVTEIGRMSIFEGLLWAIDFSPDGKLYAAFLELMLIDLDTLEITYLGEVVATDIDFAPDGFLYTIDNETKILYKMDPSFGVVVAEYGPYNIAAWGLASEVLNSPVQSDFSEVVQDSLPRALADNDPN